MSTKVSFLMIVIVFLIGTLLFAGGVQETETVKPIEIKIGVTVSADHPYTLGLQKFSEILDKEAPGKFNIQIFTDSQLGGERDLAEGVQIGTMKMGLTSVNPLSSFASKIKVFDLPYLFRDSSHAFKVLDGPIGEEILEQLLEKDIRGLAYWESGWRNITTANRPIYSPSDLRGLKIRVPESPVMRATLNAMGASAVPMAWPEVLTSLQQGTLDGQENPLVVIWYNGVYAVQKYVSLTRHFYSPAILMVNEKFYQSLPLSTQKIVKEAAEKARDYERELVRSKDQECLVNIKDAGLTVITENEIDMNAFRDSVETVYIDFGGELEALIKKIQNVK